MELLCSVLLTVSLFHHFIYRFHCFVIVVCFAKAIRLLNFTRIQKHADDAAITEGTKTRFLMKLI